MYALKKLKSLCCPKSPTDSKQRTQQSSKMSSTISENVPEQGISMAHTCITAHKIETEAMKKRGSINYTPVIKCETTQENGERYYDVFIRKDVWNIICRLADVGDNAERDYAQVIVVMEDNFHYRFNFRYNYCAKAFYDELFAEVFLE